MISSYISPARVKILVKNDNHSLPGHNNVKQSDEPPQQPEGAEGSDAALDDGGAEGGHSSLLKQV